VNGPEHYAEAERLLDHVMQVQEVAPNADRVNLAAAQVHATLAQTAATVNGRASAALDQHDEWAAVLGTADSET
jgi:hypothetical protein